MGTLAAMFHEARTFTHWQPRPVPRAIVAAAFEPACDTLRPRLPRLRFDEAARWE